MLCIYNSYYFLYYIDLRLFLPHNTGSSFWKIVFYKMWKLLMEFLHSILSSLFFFLTFIKFVSFWKENSQFLSWLNKKEILRNQKSALSPHYTPLPCHTQRSTNTTPFPGGATSAQDTEGTSPSFLEFLGKLGNRAATEGQRQYLTRAVGKSPMSISGEWGALKAPQGHGQLPPLQWRLPPQPHQTGPYLAAGTEACTSPPSLG